MRTVQKKRLLAAILIMTLILSTCVRALAAPVNEDRKIAEGYAGCCSVEIESQNESGRSSSMDTFPGYAGMKMQRESEHFIFICSDADTIWLDELESGLENSYERITAALRKVPSTKPKVSLFPDTYAYNAMLQMLYPWWPVNEDRSGGGTAISEQIAQSLPAYLRDDIVNDIYLAGPLSIGTTAVHEFAHIVANLSSSIPTYLSEGITNYLSQGSERLYMPICKDVRNDSLIHVSQLPSLASLPIQDGHDLNYSYGAEFIRFVSETLGFGAVLKLLEGASIQSVFAMGNEQVDAQWLSYLRERYGPKKETDSCWFYFDENPGDKVLKDLDNAVEEVNALLGIPVETKATIYIYSSRAALQEGTGWDATNNEDLIAGSAADGAYEIHMLAPDKVSSDWYDYPSIIDAAKGNYALSAAQQLNSESPSYLLEGFSWYATCADPSAVRYRVQHDVLNETVPALSDLPGLEASDGRWNYAAGYTAILLEYIARSCGAEQIGQILSGMDVTDVLHMSVQEVDELLQKAAVAKVNEWIAPSLPSEPPAPGEEPEDNESLEPALDSGLRIESMEWGDALTGVVAGSLTAAEICAAFEPGVQVTIMDVAGNAVSSSTVPATGMTVAAVSNAGLTQTATLVVTGDVLGTGRMNISQLVALAQAVTGTKSLTGAFFAAGDLSGSGSIDIADLVAEVKLLTQ